MTFTAFPTPNWKTEFKKPISAICCSTLSSHKIAQISIQIFKYFVDDQERNNYK